MRIIFFAMTYNSVLNAWSKSGTKLEGATKCEELLYEMIDLQIADVISFNAGTLLFLLEWRALLDCLIC